MPVKWSQLASVEERPAWGGKAAISAASRGRNVQAPRPKTALTEWNTLPVPSLPFTFRSRFSIRGSYPKRYSLLSEWIVSGVNASGDRGQVSEFALTVPDQRSWHVESRQPCNWPRTKGPTTVVPPRVAAWGLRRVKFSRPHCLATVLEEIHDEQTRGALVSGKTLEQD